MAFQIVVRAAAVAPITLPFWWKHREAPRVMGVGKEGPTDMFQNRCPGEVTRQAGRTWLKDVSGCERELAAGMCLCMCVHVCVNVCLPGEEGSQWRQG